MTTLTEGAKLTKAEMYDAAWAESIVMADLYHAALNALHAYAQATDAPAGSNVIDWFKQRSDEANDAGRTALAQEGGE